MQPRAEQKFFRSRFLDAAWRLGCAGGYEAVKIRAIADEVGASAALIYTYFEDKASLMAQLRVIGAERFEAALADRMDTPANATLLRLCELYLAYMRELEWLYVDGAGLEADGPSAGAFLHRAAALFADDDTDRDPRDAALHLWIGLQGLLVAAHHSPQLVDVRLERAHLELLLTGLGAPAQTRLHAAPTQAEGAE